MYKMLSKKNFSIKKFKKVMKISSVLLLISMLHVTATGLYSQTTKLTLNFQQATLSEVINKIENQSEFLFFYSNDDIDRNMKVSIEANNQGLEDILGHVLKNTNVMYAIKDRHVLLISKKDAANLVALQGITITGTVTGDTGETLPGVNVVIKGTAQGTVTNANGAFSITVPDANTTLVFSFVGYVSQEIAVGDQRFINVALEEDARQLEEVVVIGFGTQKKVNLTGSVSVVDSKVLEDRPVTNVVQALQGSITGLFVTNTDGGRVDKTPNITVRGLGTIGTGSKGSPLVLVDGMEGDINSLNPQDIESISILKDAASSSIYGSRAPFGVILITTKKGKTGKPVINYNGNLRTTSPVNMPEPMDSYTWALMFNDMMVNSGKSVHFDAEWLGRIKDFRDGKMPMNTYNGNQYPNTALSKDGKWLDGYGGGAHDNVNVVKAIYKDRTYAQEHNLSISGGAENMNYYVSGNFMEAPGMLKLGGDHQDRIGLMAKINTKVADFISFSYTGRFTRSKWDRPMSSKIQDWWFFSQGWPTNPAYDPNGYLFEVASPYLDIATGGRDSRVVDRISQQFNTTIEPVKDWKIIGEFNFNLINDLLHREKYKKFNHDVNGLPYPVDQNSWVAEDSKFSNFYNTNIYTEYSKEISGHYFKVLAGFQMELFKYRTQYCDKQGIIAAEKPTLNTTTGLDPNGNAVPPVASGALSNWATAGYFGRINYDYKGRYLLEGNLRYDASSRFRSDKRWMLLPSFSFGWNVAREAFWDNLKQYVSLLKIRGSYGELGNTNLDSYYPTYLTMSLGMNTGTWLLNNAKTNTANSPNPISTSLTWEKIRVYNGGIDVGVLNNRLNASIEYFVRYTDGMVGPAPTLPGIFGIAVPRTNNTSLKSQGIEFEISWQDRLSNGMNYSARFNVSDSKTTIIDYPNPTSTIGMATTDAAITYSAFNPGETWGDIWGFTTVGIAKTKAEMDAHIASLPNGGQKAMLQGGQDSKWEAGDIMYKDLNDDGKIDFGARTLNNPGDRSVIGNITPRYVFGLNLSADWKGFDVRVFFQGVMKRDYFPVGYMFWGAGRSMWESYFFKQHMDYFRDDPNHVFGQNLNSYYPRLSTPEDWSANYGKNHYFQTKYLQNAAYIRLKNLTIGYTLPKSLSQKARLEKVRIFVSGENIWTGTKLSKIFDPETIDNGAGFAYPLYKVYSAGLSITL